MDISEAEHGIPHDFGSICDAGDTKNLFVVVWNRGSVVRCDSSHVIKKKTFWTRGSRVIVPGVKLPQNELIRWIFPKRSTKYRTILAQYAMRVIQRTLLSIFEPAAVWCDVIRVMS